MHLNYGVISGSHACRDCWWHIILVAELYTTCPGERVLVATKSNVTFNTILPAKFRVRYKTLKSAQKTLMRHIIPKTIRGPTSSSRHPKTRRWMIVQINRLIWLGSVLPGLSILPTLWLHCFSVRTAVLSSCFRDITWFVTHVTQRC